MASREPIFNAPPVVVVLIGMFFAVHLLRLFLSDADSAWVTAALAFIPARLGRLAADLPGGRIAAATSFVTHVFLHGDFTHLIINSAWLLAFGSPVARRTNTLRFLAFFFVTGIAGALFYVIVNGPVLTLLVGASGAISGLMGAAFRFLFQGLAQQSSAEPGGSVATVPLMSISRALRDRRIILAVVGWTILNILLAWGAAGLTEAAGIAWEAHLGGFYVGFLTFGWFDRAPSVEHNGEDAAGAA